jgi:hypothetical protein
VASGAGIGDGIETDENMRQSGGAENEGQAARNKIERAIRRLKTEAGLQEVFDDLGAFVVVSNMANGVEKGRKTEMKMGQNNPAMSRIALMICTQVVASMPPKTT